MNAFPAPNPADRVMPTPVPPKPSKRWIIWLVLALVVAAPIVTRISKTLDASKTTPTTPAAVEITDDDWQRAWDSLDSEGMGSLCSVIDGTSVVTRDDLINGDEDPQHMAEFLDWIDDHYYDSLCAN